MAKRKKKTLTTLYVERVPKKVAKETGKFYCMYANDYIYAKSLRDVKQWLNKHVDADDRPFKVKLVKWDSEY